jgi:hypothetical protein
MTHDVMRASSLYSILLLLPPALCHMEMSWPYPFRSKYNPADSYENIDYSMTSPLLADGSNFPCKGYQNVDAQPVVTYAAGSTYNMTLAGSATHGGGSCQLSLSYDGGATFRVIKSMIGGCPLVSQYGFTIPSFAPSGPALLAWTWQNYEGNREFYMNCAKVSIVGSSYRRTRRRTTYDSLDSLPCMWKANLAGINECTTSEVECPVYPDAGPDVEYGDQMTSSSPPSSGDCDSPTPYGQTYRASGDSQPPSGPPIVSPVSSESAVTYVSPYETTPTEQSTTAYATPVAPATASPSPSLAASDDGAYAYAGNANQRVATQSQSTTTVTISDDCPATVTIFVTPSVYTTSAPQSACTTTAANCPCAQGYQCNYLGDCEWKCVASPTPSTMITLSGLPPQSTATTTIASRTSSSTIIVMTVTVSPVPASPTPSQTTSQTSPMPTSPPSSNTPSYATGDVEAYLPCVPGTCICSSSTIWYTCDYNDGSVPSESTGWVYDYPRNVSAGMECLPYLSPYSSSTAQYGQQGETSQGYYRDDRVVRARPDGDCSDEGAIQCTNGGSSFDVCDQGGWVQMGPVAAGTTCQNGQIVAS